MHIKFEFCKKSYLIKYIFDYVSKGLGQVIVSVSIVNGGGNKSDKLDKIKQFYDCLHLAFIIHDLQFKH